MVGEIRDGETADIAVRSALTGHLILSTLHTNDATGALTRLLDMGVEPYLIASSVVGIIAQRLVRLICSHCRSPREIAPGDRVRVTLGVEDQAPLTLYRGQGCALQLHGYGADGHPRGPIMDQELEHHLAKAPREAPHHSQEGRPGFLLEDGQ